MKRFQARMACALITLACAAPALAEDTTALDDETAYEAAAATMTSAPPIVVEPTLMHPSAALMNDHMHDCLLYTSPSPRDATLSRMPSSA